MEAQHINGSGHDEEGEPLLDPGDPISIAMGLRDRFQKEVSLESIREAVQAFSQALLHMERNQRYVSSQVALINDDTRTDTIQPGRLHRHESI